MHVRRGTHTHTCMHTGCMNAPPQRHRPPAVAYRAHGRWRSCGNALKAGRPQAASPSEIAKGDKRDRGIITDRQGGGRMPPGAWRNAAWMPPVAIAMGGRTERPPSDRGGATKEPFRPQSRRRVPERRAAWMRTDAQGPPPRLPGRMPDKKSRHGCRAPLRGSRTELGRPTGRPKEAD